MVEASDGPPNTMYASPALLEALLRPSALMAPMAHPHSRRHSHRRLRYRYAAIVIGFGAIITTPASHNAARSMVLASGRSAIDNISFSSIGNHIARRIRFVRSDDHIGVAIGIHISGRADRITRKITGVRTVENNSRAAECVRSIDPQGGTAVYDIGFPRIRFEIA